jgi:hypothetical protein
MPAKDVKAYVKRIVGRRTASQIASASAASFLLRGGGRLNPLIGSQGDGIELETLAS